MTIRDRFSRAQRGFRPLPAVLAVLALVLAPSLWGAEPKLGDPAPPLQIAKWVKGGPVDLAAGKGKNVYVIEFWATWCKPCLVSIPHLTQLQAKYKDKGLIIVGVSSEEVSVVEPFVKNMGEKMAYAVAVDKTTSVAARGGKAEVPATTYAYMDAFGESGIPHAFVVDKAGRIVWHGHPMSEDFEKVLDKTLAGTFDLEAQTRLTEQKRLAERAALEYLAGATDPGRKVEDVKADGEKILKDYADNGPLLNFVAYNILDSRRVPNDRRDLDLALRMAQQAVKVAAGEPEPLDTLAVALFRNGKVAEAIKTQEKAIELVKDNPAMKAGLQERLESFKAPAAGGSKDAAEGATGAVKN